MDEKIKELELKVEALYEVIYRQQEAIVAYSNCIDELIRQQESNVKVQINLFTYCKELRKRLDKVEA